MIKTTTTRAPRNWVLGFGLGSMMVALTALWPLHLQADPGDLHPMVELSASFPGPDSLRRFNAAFADLEQIFNQYHPAGIDVSTLRFDRNGPQGKPRFYIAGQIKIGPISRAVFLSGDLSVEPSPCTSTSGADSPGLMLRMTLEESQELVRTNAAEIRGHLCPAESPDPNSPMQVSFVTQMVEGPKFNAILGPAIRTVLGKQSQPLLTAIRETFDHIQ